MTIINNNYMAYKYKDVIFRHPARTSTMKIRSGKPRSVPGV